jgi:putative membrane protein
MPCLNGINGIGGGSGIWFGLLSSITTLILWGGIIGAVVFLFKSFSNKGTVSVSRTPLDILKERFAKGEISEADFERMKSQL